MSNPDAEPLVQELERLRAELLAARSASGELARVLAHDLRASLRHILSYTALLREEQGHVLPHSALGHLEVIQNAARTLNQQIEGLTAWSQLDRVELQDMAWDAGLLVSEARASLAASYAGRSMQWELPPQWPMLRGDAALLRQLFQHLLSNAIKFTRARDMAHIAVLLTPAAPGQIGLCVQDNGVGFDATRASKLFHLFQRLHSPSQFEGLGLGLALAQKIVHRHGGKIHIDAAPNAGCRVHLTLPAACEPRI